MAKKKKGPDVSRMLIDYAKEESNPFASIVLKEKKEEKKIPPLKPKKPSEIVQGYIPSLSFGDILSSFEKTGDPFALPKSKAKNISSSTTSFSSILDEWENRGNKKSKSTAEVNRSQYKATKSFEDILNEYEGKSVKKENKNENKKREDRSLSSLLSEKEEETEKTSIPDNVSWTASGGANKNYVLKKEENKEKKEEKKIERSSSPYIPKKDFSSILASYEEKKAKEEKKEVKIEVRKKEEEPPQDPFFIEREAGEEPSEKVSWSICGGVNNLFVRKEEETETIEEKVEEVVVSNPYKPERDFSEIFNEYYKKKESSREKTFEEIMKEKGDKEKKKSLSLSDLRNMDPQATLDLHGETQRDGERLINEFLLDAFDNGIRKVSIITGKGLHSESGNGVLKEMTEILLSSHELVSQVSTAPSNKGGSGALWIILKEKKSE